MRTSGIRSWSLGALLLWAVAASAQGTDTSRPRGQVLDRVVALVDGELISQLDLEFEASVLFIQRGLPPEATERLDAQALARALDVAIEQRLVTRDADKLQAFPLQPGELEAKLSDFQARFESKEAFERFLRRFEADRTMLGEVLRRQLRTERILENKIHLRAQVSEEELRRYYDEHARELGGSFDAVRGPLREKLVKEQSVRLLKEELAQLERKADIRRVAPFAVKAGGEGAP